MRLSHTSRASSEDANPAGFGPERRRPAAPASPDARFDLVVIGGGPAGLSAARVAARLGVQVAVVEAARPGGDCTWTGCVPSKTLLHIARVAHQARSAGRLGLTAKAPQVDVLAVMAAVRAAQQRVYQQESPEALRAEGIALVEGAARFISPHAVEVGGRRIGARRFVIAVGARPLVPDIPGLDEAPVFTHESVWQMLALPERLLVVGAGPMGCEFAQAFQRLGSHVTLVDMATRVLPLEDPDASALLQQRLTDEGIAVRLGAPVVRIDCREGRVVATVGDALCEGDALLLALGRRPMTSGLGLEAAGVATRGAAVQVDAGLRTSQRHIYAAGDCTGGHQYTHYAAWQGAVAARNALLPGQAAGTPEMVPRVVFTDPEIAHVGLDAATARLRCGASMRVVHWPMANIDRAVTEGDTGGWVRVVLGPADRVVGASVVGPHAGELVHEWALAIRRGMRLRDVARVLHGYPTYAFGNWQLAAEEQLSQALGGVRGPLLRWWAAHLGG